MKTSSKLGSIITTTLVTVIMLFTKPTKTQAKADSKIAEASLSANNQTGYVQTYKNSSQSRFKKANEKTTEVQIENQLNELINDSKLAIIDYVKDTYNYSISNPESLDSLKEADLNFINSILINNDGTSHESLDEALNDLFTSEKEKKLIEFINYDWENDKFEAELNNLENSYRTYSGLEIASDPTPTADEKAENIQKEIDNTTGEEGKSGLINHPKEGERTEPANNYQGINNDIWKTFILSVGIGLAGFMAVSATGLSIRKKLRRIKADKSRIKFFANDIDPKIYFNRVQKLIIETNQIKEIEKKIANLKIKIDATNDLKQRNLLEFKLNELKNEKLINNLKQTQSLKSIYEQTDKDPTKISSEQKEFLKIYSKFYSKYFKMPTNRNKKLGKDLSLYIKELNKLSAKKSSKINDLKIKINERLKSITSLNGVSQVLVDNVLNSEDSKYSKNLENLAKYFKVSDKKIGRKYLSLIFNKIKSEKSENRKKIVQNLIDELNKVDGAKNLKYYGLFNSYPINDKNNFIAPLMPSRYVISNLDEEKSQSIRKFYDEAFLKNIIRGKVLYETTVSYEVNGKRYDLVCSFDNKEVIKLMEAKFITSIPEDATNIETNTTSGKEKIESKYGIDYNNDNFVKMLKSARETIDNFENVFKPKRIEIEENPTLTSAEEELLKSKPPKPLTSKTPGLEK